MEVKKTIPAFIWEDCGRGKRKAKSMHYCSLAASNMFPRRDPALKRVVAMSDIHSVTSAVVDKLIQRRLVDKDTVVVCTGDMAGTGRMGSNADSFADYVRLRDAARALYLVQGNHDTLNPAVEELANADGSWCSVHRRVVDTPLGRVAGLHGIINDAKPDPAFHVHTSEAYLGSLAAVLALRPDVLLTHTPVEFGAPQGGGAGAGQGAGQGGGGGGGGGGDGGGAGATTVSHCQHHGAPVLGADRHGCSGAELPDVHLFGHDHYEDDAFVDVRPDGDGARTRLKLNMDARIFVFQ